MWLKKFFENKLHNQKENEMQNGNQQFQNQEAIQDSSALLDLLPDLRYQYLNKQQKQKLPFPKTVIHQTQTILFSKIQNDDGFMAKTSFGDFIPCKIVSTDKQLIILPNIFSYKKDSKAINSAYLSISLGQIQKVQLRQTKKQSLKLHITLKDTRQIVLSNKIIDFLKNLQQKIIKFGHVTGINRFYAFQFRKKNIKDKQQLQKWWKIYEIKKQFIRQGLQNFILKNGSQNKKIAFRMINNQNFDISPTYPPQFLIPITITNEQIIKGSKFRTRQRIPALTYFYEYKNQSYSSIFRCSQIKTGIMGNRCQQDQKIVKQISQCINLISKSKIVSNKHNLKIYDARGYYAALGNMIAGKGYQKQQVYNCEIRFLNIPNIHAVRDSYQKLKSFNSQIQNTDFYQIISSSGWIQYLYLILTGSNQIALDLMKGKNVLIHCSDGWDRTSQLCSLSQLLIDPYYRTLQGLAVLIQKDWRHFGHKFRDRTGQYRSINYRAHQKSPIFIQFLDCIYQIQGQFPLSFEYNHKVLSYLADHVDSCIYGTFLVNNMKQFTRLRLQNETISIWSDILQVDKKVNFLNPLYRSQLNIGYLNINVQIKNMQIWKQHLINQYTHNQTIQFSLNKQIQTNITLRNKFHSNHKIIQELKKQLNSLKIN